MNNITQVKEAIEYLLMLAVRGKLSLSLEEAAQVNANLSAIRELANTLNVPAEEAAIAQDEAACADALSIEEEVASVEDDL